MEKLGDDLLIGAEEIAEFMFGDRRKRRKIYHLASRLPLFRMGAELAARKSTLVEFIAEQEATTKAGNAA